MSRTPSRPSPLPAVLAGCATAGCALGGCAIAGGLDPVAAAGVGAGVGLLLGVGVASMAPSLGAFGPAVCRARTGRAEVALTFDDGPDRASTERLCEALEAARARGTFFLLADRARAFPDLVRRIARGGHEIALHGPRHDAWLTIRDPAVGARELCEAADVLAGLSGAAIHWFRPPFGATSPRSAEAVRRAGLRTVWCSVRPYDAGPFATAASVCAGIGRAGPGDIVLLHEGDRPAVRVLHDGLVGLVQRSLRAVTVSELLGEAS